LWTGTGTVPCNSQDAHSGRAEGFGLLAVLVFLDKYIKAANIQIPRNPKPINLYCDNLGLIQKIQQWQNQQIPQPSQMIANDYNLLIKIFHTTQHIPIPLNFQHVKGHQDQDPDTNIHELPYPAQLNIRCDECAHLALASLPLNNNPNPQLPASHPFLQINGKTIIWNTTAYLHEQACLPVYYQYLEKKFKWHPPLLHQIDWCPITYAMRKFTFLDQIQIRKIIHEWIPTWVSPSNDPTAVKDWICPTCHQTEETPEHFIRCTHITWTKIKTQLQSALTKLCTKCHVGPHIYQLWWLGLTHPSPTNGEHKLPMYPKPYRAIFWQQTQIGWKQLFYGHLSIEWVTHLSHTQPQLNPTKFLASCIATVWMTLLELWKSWNTDQDAASNRFPPPMHPQINGIYASQACLPQHAQDQIFTLSKEELLSKPKAYIENWIKNSTQYIWNKFKIQSKQQQITTQAIWQFFNPRTITVWVFFTLPSNHVVC